MAELIEVLGELKVAELVAPKAPTVDAGAKNDSFILKIKKATEASRFFIHV